MMTNTLFASAAGTAIALVVALVPTRTADADTAGTVTVSMTGKNKFSPETIEIKAGQTVVWKNDSTKVHTVTADPKQAKDPSHVELPRGVAPFDSGKIPAQGSYQHTFTTPGHYTYFCVPHEKMGMVGHIDVK